MSFTLLKAGGKWSHSRSSIPLALSQAGVPEETWHATFDGTVNRHSSFSLVTCQLTTAGEKHGREVCLTCIPFLFCIVSSILLDLIFILIGVGLTIFACFLLCNSPHGKRLQGIGEESSEHIRAWEYFVEEQHGVYRPYGIQVDMVKDAVTDKDTRPIKVVVGGLKFILVESSPPTQTRTLVQELESLHQLHQSGGLSLDEYSEAKTKLIRNTPQSSTTNVAFAEVLSQDEDSMSPNSHGLGENQAAKVNPFEIV